MKLTKMLFVACLPLLGLAEIAMSSAPLYLLPQSEAVKSVATGRESGNAVTLTAPEKGAVVALLSDSQKAYVAMKNPERRAYFADQVKRTAMRLSGYYPLSVKLKWESDAEAAHTVLVSEKPTMESAVAFAVKGGQLNIMNLKLATTYYWRVDGSEVWSFTTEDTAPRLVRIDGVPNVRDLGGRIGLGGRRVKQGLVYRTAGLNSNASKSYRKLDVIPPDRLAEIAEREAFIKTLEEEVKAGSKGEYVPYALSNDWTMFRFDKPLDKVDWDGFQKLTAVPETFQGVKPRKARRGSARNSVRFSNNKHENQVGVLCQEFESPKDGFMQVTGDCNNLWTCVVNGQKVFDIRHVECRDASSVSPDNFRYDIPVKAGKNLICFMVVAGKDGWKVYCDNPKNKLTRKDMLKKRIELEKKFISRLGSEYMGYKPGAERLNDATRVYIVNDLAWKSDIDLRSDRECFGMSGSPVGPAVTWFHYSHSAYGGMAHDSAKAVFKKVFDVFLDEKNYPICFHCIGGQDRTGAVAYILNGLLGVEDNQLYLDWELSGWNNPSAGFNHEKLFDHLVKVFTPLPGATTCEKIETYIKSIGYTDKDIERFRSIMLE